MLKKFLPLVLILKSIICSTIPQRGSVAEVPRFLESLLNADQISDDDSRVTFEDEQDVESQDDRDMITEIDYAHVNPLAHGNYEEYQSHQPGNPSYQSISDNHDSIQDFATGTIPFHQSHSDANNIANTIRAKSCRGTSNDEDFTPRIIANVQYIVSVFQRANVGRRPGEKNEYRKARKMLNDLFLELGSHRKVRAAFLKVKTSIDPRLEKQYRNVLASAEFLREEEKDKINELFLQVGYNGIIAVLKNDSSWTRPIYERTLDAVLSSPKYYTAAERKIVADHFRAGLNDAILQTRKEVRKLLEEDSSWTRPVRDDALKQIEEDLAMELMGWK
ncbi:hypothetical protein ROZALSC1DRAFT_28939 [Rozella allomycis CSF55]|uniref:Uncharacterized protein n=1 Tax=Rozella allomycis (strain CSF55) TaxID=988480 RepID=A0A075B3R4_ROZAC|nr:hypothetical protein O9G_005805 [Rozella allomycis CSF55]RKP19466.1 hypothetical protein ROZALSC1DRAFT_28939 [Rozella allomycis CSF55]|eukprot:EPZ37067.1 hypothetical protein O9G_005805 [Rozella allomycis CSF55]